MNVIDRFGSLSPAGKARIISGSIFSMVYFALGIVFLFVRDLPFVMSPVLKAGFGAILLLYSIFRMTRVAGEVRRAGGDIPDTANKGKKLEDE